MDHCVCFVIHAHSFIRFYFVVVVVVVERFSVEVILR